MPKRQHIPISSPDEGLANLHFKAGQQYERAAIINYVRTLKKNQKLLFKDTMCLGANPALMRELLTTIENTLLTGSHHK